MPTTSTSTSAGTSGMELTPRATTPSAVQKPRLVRSKSLKNLVKDKDWNGCKDHYHTQNSNSYVFHNKTSISKFGSFIDINIKSSGIP